MGPKEIEELARQPRESDGALRARLAELRSRGANLIECVKYVRLNQACDLAAAIDVVINSPAWADHKEEFLRQQWEGFVEFLTYEKDRIESIEQTTNPEGTRMVARMKPPVGPGEDTAEPGTAPDPGRA